MPFEPLSLIVIWLPFYVERGFLHFQPKIENKNILLFSGQQTTNYENGDNYLIINTGSINSNGHADYYTTRIVHPSVLNNYFTETHV